MKIYQNNAQTIYLFKKSKWGSLWIFHSGVLDHLTVRILDTIINQILKEIIFFSFFFSDLKNDVPRIYRLRGTPERGPNKKHKSATIWLNHNNLSDLNNLKKIVNDQLELPMYLTWLDISHNELKNIDQVRTLRNKRNYIFFQVNIIMYFFFWYKSIHIVIK